MIRRLVPVVGTTINVAVVKHLGKLIAIQAEVGTWLLIRVASNATQLPIVRSARKRLPPRLARRALLVRTLKRMISVGRPAYGFDVER